MAAKDAPGGKPATLGRPVQLQRLDRVERAGRRVAAAVRQEGRDDIAIKKDQRLQEQAQDPVEAADDLAAGTDTGPAACRPLANSPRAAAKSASNS